MIVAEQRVIKVRDVLTDAKENLGKGLKDHIGSTQGMTKEGDTDHGTLTLPYPSKRNPPPRILGVILYPQKNSVA